MSEEHIEVESEVVACDGGTGPLGHPRVWLNMEGRGEIVCPYCSRHFVLKKGAEAGAH
ncbi:zinc-finger domain-containing protein [Fodinicurvata sp. CAU 1616]|uniref:Zinc-finger domain-containing protein n=2 Tax=Aquibaculum arenosum TaxID=3032591 RepID=A0ABT5YK30_9PROT|nr:zinc-finger domain-containing protein [Fodinicurvata sp. CAU 1616]